MTFRTVSFGHVLSGIGLGRAFAAPQKGYLLDLCHAPRHSPRHVLHNSGTAVLEPKVILAESGNTDPGPFRDVAGAPAIHLGPREAGDVAAEPDPEPIARRHAGEVLAGE